MAYADETAVLDATGFTNAKIQNTTGLSEAQVTALIARFITKGEGVVKGWMGLPHIQRHELHLPDGEKYEYDLGTEDAEIGIGKFDPENCVEKVYAVFFNGERKKLPYPKDCDTITDGTASSYAGTNCAITDETTIKKAGTQSIKGVFSAAGKMLYPSAKDLARNINIFTHVAFRFRSSSAGATFTFKLYDKSDNYTSKTFTVEKADIWYIIMLKIDNFTDGGASIDWDGDLCYAFSIDSDSACTVYFDNFAFCDEWIYTAPSGKLIHVYDPDIPESPMSEGNEIEATYSFDPFKVTVPQEIKDAAAEMAGYYLLDYLIGNRQIDTQFVVENDTIEPAVGRDILERRKTRLLDSSKEHVATYGYSYTGGTV